MALKIRLRQQGRTNFNTYRLVVADVRSPRDGKYVESLGWYNPNQSELDKSLFVQSDRLQYWLDQGAELTDNARCLIAKSAPTVLQRYTEKAQEKRAKAISKRREQKKAA